MKQTNKINQTQFYAKILLKLHKILSIYEGKILCKEITNKIEFDLKEFYLTLKSKFKNILNLKYIDELIKQPLHYKVRKHLILSIKIEIDSSKLFKK